MDVYVFRESLDRTAFSDEDDCSPLLGHVVARLDDAYGSERNSKRPWVIGTSDGRSKAWADETRSH